MLENREIGGELLCVQGWREDDEEIKILSLIYNFKMISQIEMEAVYDFLI